MLKTLKPFAGPIAIAFYEIGASMMNWNNPFVAGLLIGIASFWFVLALFGNRALLRRVPSLLEWMPFLDPTGGFATSDHLTSKFLQGQTFNISAISQNGTMHERTFDDCTIYGPAVLAMGGFAIVSNCRFDASMELVYVATTHVPAGSIRATDCTFRNCRFFRITLVGAQEDVERWKAAV